MICEIEIIAIAMEINISSNYTLWKSAYLQCTRNRSAKMEQVVLTRAKTTERTDVHCIVV